MRGTLFVSDSAVSVSGVSKRFGSVVALDRVDLEVPRGSIVGLVGPNGAGKTTLIRLLVGSLRSDGGEVRVLGLDPSVDRRDVRSLIGYMPQSPVLYQDLTVRENVSFFARGHMKSGVAGRVEEVVDFVDLTDAIDRPVQKLSGGQQQRASLAAALVHEPDMLFLDEPTAGVDPELRHVFWTRFRDLASSGVTIVVSTHQMDEVVHCDRVSLIRSGGVLADATPAELFASAGANVEITTGNGVLRRHVSSLSTDLPALLHEMGLESSVSRIEVEGPTLEDVILGLIDEGAGGAR
jgi:ABC-2 type transport system ATP-binding protein